MPRIRTAKLPKGKLKTVAVVDMDAKVVRPMPSDQQLALQALMRRAERAKTDLSLFYSMVIKHELTKKPLTPAPHQELMFSFFIQHPQAVFRMPIGTGKCVTGNTRVVDQYTGVPRSIADLVADPAATMVQSWTASKGTQWAEVTGKYNTGRKQCIRITTRTGRSIETTPEHPYMTPTGWQQAGKLTVGCSVGLPSQVPGPAVRKSLRYSEIILLALWFTEGSTTTDARFSTADRYMLALATVCADEIGCDVKHRANYDYAVTKRHGKSSPAFELLRQHGLFGCKSVDKRIPKAMFALPDEQLDVFLSVVWACDGTVSPQDASITLASEGAIDDIQHLLLRRGVQSAKAYKLATCDGKEFNSWRLVVRSCDLVKFSSSMGTLWGSKRERLDVLLGKSRNPNAGMAIVDKAFQDEFIAEVAASGIKTSEVKLAMGWANNAGPRHTYFGIADRGNGSRGIAKGFAVAAKMAGLHKYEWLISGDTYWDEVTEVENIGEQEVFDLTVPGPNCFIANDIIAHNTFTMAAITLWLLGNDLTQRGAIVSRTRGQAEKVLSMVSDYITDPELSAALTLIFPHLKKPSGPNAQWTKSKISVERDAAIRDPSLVAVGIDGRIHGARISWLVADDCIDDENSRSTDIQEATASKFDNRLMSRLDPTGARAVVTNTPWNRHDLTYHLEENAGWPCLTCDIYGNILITNADAAWQVKAEATLVRPSVQRPGAWRLRAHDPDPQETTLLFPDRFTHASIEDIKKRMLPHEFARLMLCQPFDSESARCKKDWIEKCKKRGIGMSLEPNYSGDNPTYTGIDLAIGTKLKHDKTVLFTFEYWPDGSKRILDIESGRWEGPVILDKMLQKARDYNSVIAVENVAAQDYIRQFALERKRDLLVFAHSTNATNKLNLDFGIESVFTEFRLGNWVIPCDKEGLVHPEIERFIDACLFYQPPPAHTPDHLMACWVARERCRKSQFRDAMPAVGRPRMLAYDGGF